MEKINVDDAVGMVLCHDMTEIKDNKKTVPFRKGHILKAEDIEHLKSMGKFHMYGIQKKVIYTKMMGQK